ncbi:MAG: hypothetical protein IJK90_04175 [Bacteroidales bacterium]|nr:hypothetical protein [Bacteroidales bacterium]
MKRIIWILALAAALTAACKGDKPQESTPVDTPEAIETPETTPVAATAPVRMEDIPFDELFSVFSVFGDNIMSDLFASKVAKEQIKDELREGYASSREFNGNACNSLAYAFNVEGCYDGFLMGCWKYDADGHLLVLLDEEGGCDVNSTKYIRAYDYDPATRQAHEVDFPLNPQPKPDDFEDLIRLAGCLDIPSIRNAMRDRIYNYSFSPEGVTVYLNITDEWEPAGNCGFQLFYRWNGSEFVRDKSVPFPCIHSEGFAMIKLGEPMPATDFDYDPLDYDIRYSDEGALWLVNRDGARVLEVQLDGEDVESVEVFDPRYSVQLGCYWLSKDRLCVGSRIADYVDFSEEDSPAVWLYSDGTVSLDKDCYYSILSLRTTSSALEGKVPAVPGTEVKVRVENPKFKPAATVKSIVISRKHQGE